MSANRRLAVTLGVIWVVASLVGLFIISVLPFPPAHASDTATSISNTLRLLTYLAWPIFSGVITGIVGSMLIGRRDPNARPASHDRIRGNPRLAGLWVGVIGFAVLLLAVFGTLTLTNEEAADALGLAGRGTSGTSVGSSPDNTDIEVQVIAQQWQFTYRYPAYGGMESAHLVLPADARVTFHITSLDVTHSFWFPAIGVKADAVPNNDNVFSTRVAVMGTYRIQCSELCGLWHGSMDDNSAQIVSGSDFSTWAKQQQAADAPVMQYLPPYSHTYVPLPAAYGT
ncbi:MAG: cytochrome c oxidase subunit II [Candidatus Dormibacteraeota bacterium]|uniref:Cytochrome aa3 subunit 2 n=1 Tax=Candidatus Amunia macphersoniae TaxID=3127014 RepID=A0A934KMN0_9BACT|nr:cytochrome c oxidase subunit II [Candidatus Dormibacteraeota bacterium]